MSRSLQTRSGREAGKHPARPLPRVAEPPPFHRRVAITAPKPSAHATPARKSDRTLLTKWARQTASLPFGPDFFSTWLGAFVRDRCPTPADGLPVVLVHLGDGEILDVCHVIGLARHFVALAAHDERGLPGPPRMRTAIVPYEAIGRITLRTEPEGDVHIGFRQESELRTFVTGSQPAAGALLAPPPTRMECAR